MTLPDKPQKSILFTMFYEQFQRVRELAAIERRTTSGMLRILVDYALATYQPHDPTKRDGQS